MHMYHFADNVIEHSNIISSDELQAEEKLTISIGLVGVRSDWFTVITKVAFMPLLPLIYYKLNPTFSCAYHCETKLKFHILLTPQKFNFINAASWLIGNISSTDVQQVYRDTQVMDEYRVGQIQCLMRV